MPSPLKLALALLPLCLAMSAPQAAAKTHDDDSDAVLVSFEQGQALADFALQSGARRVRPKPDCSHLVHLLYSRAGLIYPYEDSRVLYRGVDDFERVKTPQPGDLVVWLGHVGIVLSPEDKTFFSSVRSGIITESWTAPHWLRRGRPRFLRYRIGPSANLTLLAAIMDGSANTQRHTDAQRYTLSQNNNNEARNNEARGNSRSTAAAQQIEQDEPAAQDDRNVASPDDRNSASQQDEPQRAPTQPRAMPQRERAESPAIVAILHQYQTPGKREIAAAILESSATRSRQLIAGQTLDLARPLSVFASVEVTRIKVKHQSGSVTLKLVESMSQEAGRILPGRTIERELFLVRQNNGVWAISDPRERTYVPQAQAVSVFERQAELFLRDAPNSIATRAVVKALDRLYDLQADAAQRAAVR